MRPGAFALILVMAGAGLLAACERTGAPSPVKETNGQARATCEKTAEALGGQWIGKSYEALKPSLDPAGLPGVERVRSYAKGSALTMDYIPLRLNVEYDDGGKVTRIHCG